MKKLLMAVATVALFALSVPAMAQPYGHEGHPGYGHPGQHYPPPYGGGHYRGPPRYYCGPWRHGDWNWHHPGGWWWGHCYYWR
jgi:hypothetical protein